METTRQIARKYHIFLSSDELPLSLRMDIRTGRETEKTDALRPWDSAQRELCIEHGVWERPEFIELREINRTLPRHSHDGIIPFRQNLSKIITLEPLRVDGDWDRRYPVRTH
jgi:hypothetical protein